jgi:hypothetical protein
LARGARRARARESPIPHKRRLAANRLVRRLSARKILLHSNYEGTDLEELARDIGFRPVDQTDAGKLAREVDLSPRRDDDLVSHQKHDPDALAV